MDKGRFNSRCDYCDFILKDVYRIFGDYVLYKCSNCDLVNTIVPKRHDLKKENQKYYNETYISNYLSRTTILGKRFLERVSEIERRKQGGRILDVGCGVGLFLEILLKKSKYKWQVCGIDINRKLVELAKRRVRGKIYCNKLNTKVFKKDFFDCITCFDVLEHDINLKQNICIINKVLKKDGLFVIQSPNYRSVMAGLTGKEWDWWSVPDHLLHFTPEFLTKVLKENGFGIQKVRTWEPRHDFVLNVKSVIKIQATPFYFINRLISKLSGPLLSILWFIIKVFEKKINIGGLTLIYAVKL